MTTSLPVTIASLVPGEFVAIVVEWDQPYVTRSQQRRCDRRHRSVHHGRRRHHDRAVQQRLHRPSGPNSLGSFIVMIVANPANASGNTKQTLVVGLANGTAPGRIKVSVEDDGAAAPSMPSRAMCRPHMQGHPGSAGAAGIYLRLRLCGVTSSARMLSSAGGAPILFDVAGTRLATPVVVRSRTSWGRTGVMTRSGLYTGKRKNPRQHVDRRLSERCQLSNFFGTSEPSACRQYRRAHAGRPIRPQRRRKFIKRYASAAPMGIADRAMGLCKRTLQWGSYRKSYL